MREEDTLRLIQALIISRIAYSLPYHVLSYRQTEKANAIIRTAYKAALGLPIYTANQKLYDLGVCNTFEEIRDATLALQKERLLKTPPGRTILTRVGSKAEVELIGKMTDMTPDQRKGLKPLPIPKNMHKTIHKETRTSKTNFLKKKFGHIINSVYTDVSVGSNGFATAVISDFRGRLIDCITIMHQSIDVAETSAVMLAIRRGETNNKSLKS